MNLSPTVTYIACPQAPFFILCIMPIGALIVVMTCGFKSPLKLLCIMIVWVVVIFISIKAIFTPRYKEILVPCSTGLVRIVGDHGLITLYDESGALRKRSCNRAWIYYTLRPLLIKHFGSRVISRMVLRNFSKKSDSAMRIIADECLCRDFICQDGKLLKI